MQYLSIIFFGLFLFCCYIANPADPVGSARPKFPMTDTMRAFTVRHGYTQTLFCPAQAFPVPAFRYNTSFHRFLHHYKYINKTAHSTWVVDTLTREKNYTTSRSFDSTKPFMQLHIVLNIVKPTSR